ncbi:MAG: hypothetical protein Q7J32_17525 [Sphingomonadaceae bacterium]|nr:hypothetical protein [Sphingomonadaceae bacterium]
MRTSELAPYPPAVRRMIARQPRKTAEDLIDEMKAASATRQLH